MVFYGQDPGLHACFPIQCPYMRAQYLNSSGSFILIMTGIAQKLAAHRLLNDRLDSEDLTEIVADHFFGPQVRKIKRAQKLIHNFKKLI